MNFSFTDIAKTYEKYMYLPTLSFHRDTYNVTYSFVTYS